MPAMKRLHLLVTGLCPDFGPETATALKGLACPALTRLLSRGQPCRAPVDTSLTPRLGRLFQIPASPDIPIGPLRLLADGVDPGAGQWWCADPVHLQLMLDHLRLGGRSGFDITADEANALVASLNQHFAGDAAFVAPVPDRWYVQFITPVVAHATPLDAALGQSLRTCLPQGDDGGRLQRLMNEAQMLLHAHPVNQQRESQGQEPVNSIWIWGGGSRVAPRPLAGRLLTDSATALALARASATPCGPLPDRFTDMDDEFPEQWVLLDSLMPLACDGRIRDWQDEGARLERDWFAPIWQALRQGRLESLHLEILGPQARAVRLGRQDTWRFWRKPGSPCPGISQESA